MRCWDEERCIEEGYAIGQGLACKYVVALYLCARVGGFLVVKLQGTKSISRVVTALERILILWHPES